MALEPRPQFVDVNPDTLVENVYPVQGTHEDAAELDVESWRNMADFLRRRHEDVHAGAALDVVTVLQPQTETRVELTRWAYLPPVKTPRGWRRATVAGLLGVNLLLNLGNIKTLAEDTKEEVAALADGVADYLSGEADCERRDDSEKSSETETVLNTHSFFASKNSVGEFVPQSQPIGEVVESISKLMRDGHDIKINIASSASDEWLASPEANRDIGSDTEQNEALAEQRAAAFTEQLREEALAQGVDLTGVEILQEASERVLTEAETTDLLATLDKFGLSVDDAILAANQGLFSDLPTDIQDKLTLLITNMRGVRVDIISVKQEATSTTETVPGNGGEQNCDDTEPKDENHDYDWGLLPFLWPALPLFARKRITRLVAEQVETHQFNPLDVLIHPEGTNEDNTQMRRNVWAYIRKFMHLLREDDRIQKVQELSYENSESEPLALRVLYIDHEPTEATKAMVSEVLELATTITDGQIGKDVDIIAIYPRESSGHQNGSRRGRDIALGLDTQHDASTLGVAYGNLGIVELHMDQAPSDKDLDQAYMSAKWVLVHELLGHFTGLDQHVNKKTLIELGQAPDGRDLYTTNNAWATPGLGVYTRGARFAEQMARPGANPERVRWRAWLPGDNTPTEITGVSDQRLLEAERLELLDSNTSDYGDTSVLEAWAEAAASYVTQTPAPFENAPIEPVRTIRRTRPDQGAGGSIVNKQWVAELQRVWGRIGDEDLARIEASWQRSFGNPDQFEFMRELGEFARSAEIWAQDDPRWIRLITGQLFNK